MTLLRRGVWAYLRVPYCGWEKNVGILFRFIVPRLKRLPPPPPPPPLALLLKTTPTLLTYDLHTHTPHASTPPTPVCREHRLASKLPKVPRGVFSSPNGQAVRFAYYTRLYEPAQQSPYELPHVSRCARFEDQTPDTPQRATTIDVDEAN